MTFESFGFKHGPGRDADLLFDVRFLPNPHYEPNLRPLTGRDPAIVAFINADGALDRFLRARRLTARGLRLLLGWLRQGKAHGGGVGCTGGRHRSVAIAEHLADRYRSADGYLVDVAAPRP